MKAPELHPVTVDVRGRDDFSWGRAGAFAFGALLALVFLTALQLTGCASASAPLRPELGIRRWGTESARIVIDHRAPECMFWAVREALDVLRPRVNVAVERGMVSQPAPGEILVVWGQPSGALGLTTSWQDERFVYRAIVLVPECRARLLAHELGHAFGLVNVSERGRLMTTAYRDGGYTLSLPERNALRRR